MYGVRVLTIPMRERSSVAVAVWVRTGARFESKKLSGVSHYLEHMLFKGTKKRTTRQIKEEIEGVGGMLNAFTGEESTCYFAKILSQHYPIALDVLSDMVNHASLDSKELEKERPVILEEIKMYRDLPAHHVHDLMGELLWPNQPLGRPIAGTPETVSGISRQGIKDYKERYYHPRNILVSISGAVHHRDVLKRVQDCFAIKAAKSASKFKAAVSKQAKSRLLFIEKDTEQTHFVIGLHGVSRHHPDRYKLGILNVIMGANMSSRLFEEVREKRGLAYEIKSGLNFLEDAGAVTVSAGVENKKIQTAINVILKELDKVSKHGVKENELRRAKDYFMSQLYMALEDTLDHALWLGEKTLYGNQLPDREQIRKSVEAVTRGHVQDIAKKIYKTSNLNLTLIGPVPEKIQSRIRRDFEINGRA